VIEHMQPGASTPLTGGSRMLRRKVGGVKLGRGVSFASQQNTAKLPLMACVECVERVKNTN